MIPFFKLEYFFIGPIKIYVWGLFVTFGILTAVYLLWKKGFFRAPKGDRNFNLIIYLIVAAIIGGRLGYVFFYDIERFLERPLDIFKIWDGGMASFGGFIAAGLILFFWREENKLKLLDTLAIPFLSGWIIGRLGCFFIHDHPGRFTNFFLAVRFPSATIHDMALYEILLSALFLIGYIILKRHQCLVSLCMSAVCREDQRGRPGIIKFDGLLFISLILYYSFFRFFLDFLRVLDPYWLGLIPSQFAAILFFAFGLVLVWKVIFLTKKDEFAKIHK